ncbi:MAG TPA: homoserine O-acetyltransferase, partial [Candidatus Eisenbacteria bacterium]|nr:homoserine O-acetyltransferase [Candidatus Eisenbacteria bacterium]
MSADPERAARVFALPAPLALDSGATLAGVALAYRTWGALDADGGNAVVVGHALTGSAAVDAWWPEMLGRGRALDPTRDFVICANVPGSCYGSTGPASPAPDGRPWGRRFPALTVRDLVRAQQPLLDHLGVLRVRLALGGSLGGMQALEWALMDARVEAAAVIAAPARHEAWAIAWSDAQRRALAADPAWEAGGEPRAGLAAARAIAMLSYRSPASLAARFGRERGAREPFAVRDWLAHHGRSLVARFDARSYAALLDAMDAHDVGAGRGGVAAALASVRAPVLVLAIASDHLYPPAESEALAAALP